MNDWSMEKIQQHLSPLGELNLSGQVSTATDFENILKFLELYPVNKLDLSSNKIGDVGASKLSEILQKTDLLVLDLSNNQIGDQGAMALTNSISNSKIQKLHLNSNNISQKGFVAIAKELGHIQVQTLDKSSLKWGWSELKNWFLARNNKHRKIGANIIVILLVVFCLLSLNGALLFMNGILPH